MTRLFVLLFSIFLARISVAEPALPLLSAGDSNASTKLEFFLSPSCPMCAGTFRNSVLPLLKEAASRPDFHVAVAIMPRSQEDVQFARVLTCVPQQNLLAFMTEWYTYRANNGADLKSMIQMGAKHGIEAMSEDGCKNNRNDRMFLAFNRFVFVESKLKQTPAVFLNRKHVPEVFYLWQFQSLLPKLNLPAK